MTNELIQHLTKKLEGYIHVDELHFFYSKKYTNPGLPKSLYLVFAAYNYKYNCANSITYCVGTGHVDIRMWAISAKYKPVKTKSNE